MFILYTPEVYRFEPEDIMGVLRGRFLSNASQTCMTCDLMDYHNIVFVLFLCLNCLFYLISPEKLLFVLKEMIIYVYFFFSRSFRHKKKLFSLKEKKILSSTHMNICFSCGKEMTSFNTWKKTNNLYQMANHKDRRENNQTFMVKNTSHLHLRASVRRHSACCSKWTLHHQTPWTKKNTTGVNWLVDMSQLQMQWCKWICLSCSKMRSETGTNNADGVTDWRRCKSNRVGGCTPSHPSEDV